MAAIVVNSTVNTAPKKKVASDFKVLLKTYNGKPMFIVCKEGQEENFKAYSYNSGVPKVDALFSPDKDGDSILLEMAKFAINNGVSIEKIQSAVDGLSEGFAKFKDSLNNVD